MGQVIPPFPKEYEPPGPPPALWQTIAAGARAAQRAAYVCAATVLAIVGIGLASRVTAATWTLSIAFALAAGYFALVAREYRRDAFAARLIGDAETYFRLRGIVR